MEKQINQCHFLIKTSNGTSNTEIFNGNINVFSGSYSYVPYYYSGSSYDESIRGTLRSQLGGYRFEATLQWNRLINSTPFYDVLNKVVESSNITTIYFAPNASNTSINVDVLVVPTEVTAVIDATLIRQPLGLQAIGRTVEQEIPSWFKL